MIEYSASEMEKINPCFPNLYYERGVVRGEIDFSARYKLSKRKKKEEWKIESCSSGNDCIRDVYEIKIHLNFGSPKVFEVGGRIERRAKMLNKSIEDMHLNADKSCCLGLFLPNKHETLSDFVLKKVYPYFVWQAYFERFGKTPPCGEFPHGREGVNEFWKHVRNIGRNAPCPCGSGRKFKRCCSSVLAKQIEFFIGNGL